jgi:hypothetical protein
MKKVALYACLAIVGMSVACNQAEKPAEVTTDLINNPATGEEGADVSTENLPAFEFEEEVIDFGQISQGEKVKQRFRFKNVGKSDLIISDAKGSCGCTVPAWPRQPIRPGQEGEIEVVFDSNGKQGRQNKTVTLVANTVPKTKVIAINGEVLVPEQTNEQ